MERVVAMFTVKLGSKPLGIWVAWLGLLYAAMTFANKFFVVASPVGSGHLSLVEAAVTCLLIIVAMVALLRRRLIARMFGGMAMTLLFFHCLFWDELRGMILAPVAVICLIANRRWFDEKLPPAGW